MFFSSARVSAISAPFRSEHSLPFVLGHEVHPYSFLDLFMGRKIYSGPIFSHEVDLHRLRDLFLRLKFDVMPLGCSHIRNPPLLSAKALEEGAGTASHGEGVLSDKLPRAFWGDTPETGATKPSADS